MSAAPIDRWAIGSAYERFVGRWSRPVAAEFVDWLQMPTGAAWLDVGCGTGALTETVLTHAGPIRVTGVDASAHFVGDARARLNGPHTRFVAARAQQLPFVSAHFDAVVSGLVLNFVPSPAAAVMEMCRVARPASLVAVYVWDYAGGMQLMRIFWDTAVALDPAATPLDEGTRFPLCHPDRLAALFSESGLEDVETRAIDVSTRFASFDDYWTPFLGGQGPAPSYVVSLTEDRRHQLRDALHCRLPIAPDGSIALTARAWAARGRTRS